MKPEARDRALEEAQRPGGEHIEVHIVEMKPLFNSMDPSPFNERDLDPHAAHR